MYDVKAGMGIAGSRLLCMDKKKSPVKGFQFFFQEDKYEEL